MTTEELFIEATKRYPIGTRVNSLGGTQDHLITDNTRPYLDNSDNYLRLDANCVVYDFRDKNMGKNYISCTTSNK